MCTHEHANTHTYTHTHTHTHHTHTHLSAPPLPCPPLISLALRPVVGSPGATSTFKAQPGHSERILIKLWVKPQISSRVPKEMHEAASWQTASAIDRSRHVTERARRSEKERGRDKKRGRERQREGERRKEAETSRARER